MAPPPVQDLKTTLAQELDFENEVRNMEQCRQDLAVFPWLHVPRVEKELSSKRVLTAEWIDGCRVTDKAALDKMCLSRADVRPHTVTLSCALARI